MNQMTGVIISVKRFEMVFHIKCCINPDYCYYYLFLECLFKSQRGVYCVNVIFWPSPDNMLVNTLVYHYN